MYSLEKISKIAKEILDSPKTPENNTKNIETTVPQEEIDKAIEIATTIRQKIDSLSSEIDIALQDLNGENKPSVLESKEDFKTLTLRLEQIKKKITVV